MKQIPLSAQLVMPLYVALIAAHILALQGIDPTGGKLQGMQLLVAFFFILIPFWFLLVMKANQRLRFSSRTFIFKYLAAGVPPWMLKMVFIATLYGVASFVFMFLNSLGSASKEMKDGLFQFRFFTAHLSIFYALTIAGLTGLTNYRAPTCPNGHEIQNEAKYCPECGVPIDASSISH